jgi:ferritin-like metal-binding protein YciE
MRISTIGEKFIHDLSALYDAELRFFDAQLAMLENVSNPQLQAMLVEHRDQTRVHIENLEQIFDILGGGFARSSNEAAAGLVEAGDTAIQAAHQSPWYRDCVILSAVGQVEHYEIASYRNLIATAERFQRGDLSAILRQNLSHEEQAAQKAEDGYATLLDEAISTQKLHNVANGAQPVYS